MGLSVREKAEYVGTFRAIRVYLMEMLARWTPDTPELEAKVLFGRHIWDTAQHADLLGKRALELRASLHYTLRPAPAYMKVLETAAALKGTADRIRSVYEVILPGLERRQAFYLANTDRLQDEPTTRIIDAMQRDDARMADEARQTLVEMNLAGHGDAALLEALRRADLEAVEFVQFGTGATLARGAA
jgi:hypothetical protein